MEGESCPLASSTACGAGLAALTALFAGSDTGAEGGAAIGSLIGSAKLNGSEPEADLRIQRRKFRFGLVREWENPKTADCNDFHLGQPLRLASPFSSIGYADLDWNCTCTGTSKGWMGACLRPKIPGLKASQSSA